MKVAIRQNRLTIVLHVLCWGALLILPQLVNMPEWREQGKTYGLPYPFFLLTTILNIFLFYFNAFYLYPRLFHRRTWLLYFLSLLVLLMLVNGLKVALLKGIFRETPINSYTARYIFFPAVLLAFVSFLYRLVRDKLRHDKLLQEKQSMQLATELKLLRSQVSPHFLFNVLNGMVALSRQQSAQLEPALIRLSGLMRYMLYQSDVQQVSLRQEVTYLQDYMALQRLRFDHEVLIRECWGDVEEQHMIAPMLLIPFVENAFKHGIGIAPASYIHVDLAVAGDQLDFRVENSCPEAAHNSKDKDSGIGLSNVRARLELIYKGRYRLDILQEAAVFRIHLQLPLV